MFFPIEPPSMESAGSYKLLSGRFCIESFAKVWSKSISYFLLSSQHFGGREMLFQKSLQIWERLPCFLRVCFGLGFSAGCFPSEPELEWEQSLCCWQIVGALLPPHLAVTTSSLPGAVTVSGCFPLLWGAAAKTALLLPVVGAEAEGIYCISAQLAVCLDILRNGERGHCGGVGMSRYTWIR